MSGLESIHPNTAMRLGLMVSEKNRFKKRKHGGFQKSYIKKIYIGKIIKRTQMISVPVLLNEVDWQLS